MSAPQSAAFVKMPPATLMKRLIRLAPNAAGISASPHWGMIWYARKSIDIMRRAMLANIVPMTLPALYDTLSAPPSPSFLAACAVLEALRVVMYIPMYPARPLPSAPRANDTIASAAITPLWNPR